MSAEKRERDPSSSDSSVEPDSKKQKTEANNGGGHWKPPAKFEQVKKELQAKQWPEDKTVSDLISDMIPTSEEDAFFIADLGEIVAQYRKWVIALPDVTPYYAVKCNPTEGMLKTLEALGANFDCASKGEIESVLNLGVDPSRIIYANPCKQISALKYAREKKVTMMTFDNLNEMEKIEKYFPEAQLVLRIAPDDSHSLMRFGSKFGVHPDDCHDLLEMALEMKLSVVGVSFHVGSGCFSEVAYDSALTLVKRIFDEAKSLNINLKLVDIGGGFSGSDTELFYKFTNTIKQKKAELFDPSVKFIAEPGRYFAAASHTLAVTVISKRTMKQEDNRQHVRRTSNNRRQYNYYLADGVYGSFNNIQNDHAHPNAHLVKPNTRPPTSCTLFGPTCDSLMSSLVIYNYQSLKWEIGYTSLRWVLILWLHRVHLTDFNHHQYITTPLFNLSFLLLPSFLFLK